MEYYHLQAMAILLDMNGLFSWDIDPSKLQRRQSLRSLEEMFKAVSKGDEEKVEKAPLMAGGCWWLPMVGGPHPIFRNASIGSRLKWSNT